MLFRSFLPRPGDFLTLMRDGQLQRRARVVSAERHRIVETPQRELRAGPAVFFRFRCPGELLLPAETLVVRLVPAVEAAKQSVLNLCENSLGS